MRGYPAFVATMPSLTTSDSIAIALAIVGLAIAFANAAAGTMWTAAWVGSLLLLVGSRHRLPRFVPRKAPAILPNIDPSRVEGTPAGYGAWLMSVPAMMCLLLAPVALIRKDAQLVFAIPTAMMLAVFTWLAFAQDRGSARVAARILGASANRRVVGVVASLAGRFERHIAWRTWTATSHGTATVDAVGGGRVTVATVRHATHGCGTREEIRSAIRITSDTAGESVEVHTDNILWAGVPQPMPDKLPRIRRLGASEEAAMNLFPVVLRELEIVNVGDRVVVVADRDAIAELRGRPDAPLLAFVLGVGDPLQTLRRHLAVRRGFLLGLAVCTTASLLAGWLP